MTHTQSNSAAQIASVFGGRRGVRLLAFALVALGVCVFAWGLKYKLSLYDPPHSLSHRIPAAKLLTGKERSAQPVVQLRRAEIPHPPQPLNTLATAFLVLLGARLWARALGERPVPAYACFAPQCGILRTIFTRPPPFRS